MPGGQLLGNDGSGLQYLFCIVFCFVFGLKQDNHVHWNCHSSRFTWSGVIYNEVVFITITITTPTNAVSGELDAMTMTL